VVSISRGDIFWVDFGQAENSAPAQRHPMVIVQTNSITSTKIATVIGGLITTNPDAPKFKGAVFFPKEVTNLPKDSTIRLTELATVDKWQLLEYAGRVPAEFMIQIDNALREVLEL
jgi:mRNA-degrading endonuclease toxin of MazEF toxin-antitoxin module